MSKLGKAFRALFWIARKPALLNRVLTDEDSWHGYVEKRFKMPGGLPVVQMDRLIGPGPVTLGPMTFLEGGSLPTDLMLLGGLAGVIEDCTYFEIGTWRGESVATVASRAKSCYTLCLTDEEMRRKGMHRSTIESHRLFSKKLDNVIQLRGDSRNFDYKGLHRKFDLIYIDGEHHYDFLKSDTEKVFRYPRKHHCGLARLRVPSRQDPLRGNGCNPGRGWTGAGRQGLSCGTHQIGYMDRE